MRKHSVWSTWGRKCLFTIRNIPIFLSTCNFSDVYDWIGKRLPQTWSTSFEWILVSHSLAMKKESQTAPPEWPRWGQKKMLTWLFHSIPKTKVMHIRCQDAVSSITRQEEKDVCKYICSNEGCDHCFLNLWGLKIHESRYNYRNHFEMDHILGCKGPIT